ncbi:MAG: LamG domain-containing protein [Candidatus Poribacteria bacterium]|nr:LamG domain-containing protein [Candidatus Poribacteria bacterium]
MAKRLQWFALVFVGFTSVAFAQNKDALVLYMQFNEGAGATAKDSSGNKHDGKLMKEASWGDGIDGGGLVVTNVGYVEVDTHDDLALGDKATFEAWINIEGLLDGYSAIYGKADTYMMHLDQEGRPAGMVGVEPYLWPTVEWPPVFKKNIIAIGEWHYVAGVFTGTNRQVYVDGELTDEGPHTGAPGASGVPFSIGYDNRGCCAARRMNATIDEVRVWNRALSADEIAENYEGAFLAVQPADKAATTWAALKSSR